ncbi:MAG: DUF3293 domain-containing protein, partial [Polynucleobacter victoriensis]
MLNKIYQEFSDEYSRAEYVVLSSPPIVFKIDERCAELDELMAGCGVSVASFITACNPRGMYQSDGENILGMNQLQSAIDDLRLPYFKGFGRDPEGTWKEDSYLIMGIELDQACQLERLFEQNAIV